jgi:hypothetical protein
MTNISEREFRLRYCEHFEWAINLDIIRSLLNNDTTCDASISFYPFTQHLYHRKEIPIDDLYVNCVIKYLKARTASKIIIVWACAAFLACLHLPINDKVYMLFLIVWQHPQNDVFWVMGTAGYELVGKSELMRWSKRYRCSMNGYYLITHFTGGRRGSAIHGLCISNSSHYHIRVRGCPNRCHPNFLWLFTFSITIIGDLLIS